MNGGKICANSTFLSEATVMIGNVWGDFLMSLITRMSFAFSWLQYGCRWKNTHGASCHSTWPWGQSSSKTRPANVQSASRHNFISHDLFIFSIVYFTTKPLHTVLWFYIYGTELLWKCYESCHIEFIMMYYKEPGVIVSTWPGFKAYWIQ